MGEDQYSEGKEEQMVKTWLDLKKISVDKSSSFFLGLKKF